MTEFPYLPTETEYRKAFRSIASKLTSNQRKMLELHLRQVRPVTATELADQVGYKNWRGVNAQYGRVGALLRKYSPVFANLPGQASHAFASFYQIPRKDKRYTEWVWALHGAARSALDSLGWFPSKK